MTFLSGQIYAQRYEIGLIGAGTGYMGDINPTNPFYVKSVGAGLSGKYNFNPTWGAKLSINHLHIKGDDLDFDNTYQQRRKLNFQNHITELSLTGEFNFYTFFNKKKQQSPNFTPYIFAGIGVFKHNPYVEYEGYDIALNPLRLEYDETTNPDKYSTWNINLPLGFGVKYHLNDTWAIGAELAYRIAFTDNIDNVSKYYATGVPARLMVPNINILDGEDTRKFNLGDWEYLADPSGQLMQNAGTARGDGKTKDGYMTVGITLSYSIFSADCFSWRK